MDSMYAEVVVKPKQPVARNVVAYIIYGFTALLLFASVYYAMVLGTILVITYALVPVIAIGALTTFFYRAGKIEYEYLYCDDVLIIAKITNKSKRKNVLKLEMDNIEMCGLVEDAQMKSFRELPKKDFSSAKRENPVYAMVTAYKGKKLWVEFEPSEKLISCMKIKLGTRFCR